MRQDALTFWLDRIRPVGKANGFLVLFGKVWDLLTPSLELRPNPHKVKL